MLVLRRFVNIKNGPASHEETRGQSDAPEGGVVKERGSYRSGTASLEAGDPEIHPPHVVGVVGRRCSRRDPDGEVSLGRILHRRRHVDFPRVGRGTGVHAGLPRQRRHHQLRPTGRVGGVLARPPPRIVVVVRSVGAELDAVVGVCSADPVSVLISHVDRVGNPLLQRRCGQSARELRATGPARPVDEVAAPDAELARGRLGPGSVHARGVDGCLVAGAAPGRGEDHLGVLDIHRQSRQVELEERGVSVPPPSGAKPLVIDLSVAGALHEILAIVRTGLQDVASLGVDADPLRHAFVAERVGNRQVVIRLGTVVSGTIRVELTHDEQTGPIGRDGLDADLVRAVDELPDGSRVVARPVEVDHERLLQERVGHGAGAAAPGDAAVAVAAGGLHVRLGRTVLRGQGVGRPAEQVGVAAATCVHRHELLSAVAVLRADVDGRVGVRRGENHTGSLSVPRGGSHDGHHEGQKERRV